jgi:AcrR family transcriptional regulator
MAVSNNPNGRPRSVQITEKLHRALWDLLEELEYDEITMERVALAARVSRPTLYRRYLTSAT